ncbi:membrane hypothetical protein [Burkholderiales bacterium 8X]|nr:membrane hypothetical protein [Burkholderiales bacterium 8X]
MESKKPEIDEPEREDQKGKEKESIDIEELQKRTDALLKSRLPQRPQRFKRLAEQMSVAAIKNFVNNTKAFETAVENDRTKWRREYVNDVLFQKRIDEYTLKRRFVLDQYAAGKLSIAELRSAVELLATDLAVAFGFATPPSEGLGDWKDEISDRAKLASKYYAHATIQGNAINSAFSAFAIVLTTLLSVPIFKIITGEEQDSPSGHLNPLGVAPLLLGFATLATIIYVAVWVGKYEGIGLARQTNLAPDFAPDIKSDLWKKLDGSAGQLRLRVDIEAELAKADAPGANRLDLQLELLTKLLYDQFLKQEHSTQTRLVRNSLNMMVPVAGLIGGAYAFHTGSAFPGVVIGSGLGLLFTILQPIVYAGMHTAQFGRDNKQKIITAFQIAVVTGRGEFTGADPHRVDPTKIDQLMKGPICLALDNFRALIDHDLLVYQAAMCGIIQRNFSDQSIEAVCRQLVTPWRPEAERDADNPMWELSPLWELFHRGRSRFDELQLAIATLLEPEHAQDAAFLEEMLHHFEKLRTTSVELAQYKVEALLKNIDSFRPVEFIMLKGIIDHPENLDDRKRLVKRRAHAEAATNLTSIQQTAHKIGVNFTKALLGSANTFTIKAGTSIATGALICINASDYAKVVSIVNMSGNVLNLFACLASFLVVRSAHEFIAMKALQRKRDDAKNIKLPHSSILNDSDLIRLDRLLSNVTIFKTFVAKELDETRTAGLVFHYKDQTTVHRDNQEQMLHSFLVSRWREYLVVEGGNFYFDTTKSGQMLKDARQQLDALVQLPELPGTEEDSDIADDQPTKVGTSTTATDTGTAATTAASTTPKTTRLSSTQPRTKTGPDRLLRLAEPELVAACPALVLANMIWNHEDSRHLPIDPPPESRLRSFKALLAWLQSIEVRSPDANAPSPLFRLTLQRPDRSAPWPDFYAQMQALGIESPSAEAVGLQFPADDAEPSTYSFVMVSQTSSWIAPDRRGYLFHCTDLARGKVEQLRSTRLPEAVQEALSRTEALECEVLMRYRFATLKPAATPAPGMRCLYHARTAPEGAPFVSAAEMLLMALRGNRPVDLASFPAKSGADAFFQALAADPSLPEGLRLRYDTLTPRQSKKGWSWSGGLAGLDQAPAIVVMLAGFTIDELALLQKRPTSKQVPHERFLLLAYTPVYRQYLVLDPMQDDVESIPRVATMTQALSALLATHALGPKVSVLSPAGSLTISSQTPALSALSTASVDFDERSALFVPYGASPPAKWQVAPPAVAGQAGGVGLRGDEPAIGHICHQSQAGAWCGLHASQTMLWRNGFAYRLTPSRFKKRFGDDATRAELPDIRTLLNEELAATPGFAIGTASLKNTGNLAWTTLPPPFGLKLTSVVFTYQGAERASGSIDAGDQPYYLAQHSVCVVRDNLSANVFYLIDSLDQTGWQLSADNIRDALAEAIAGKCKFSSVELLFMFKLDDRQVPVVFRLVEEALHTLEDEAAARRSDKTRRHFARLAGSGYSKSKLLAEYSCLYWGLESVASQLQDDEQIRFQILERARWLLWDAMRSAMAAASKAVPMLLESLEQPELARTWLPLPTATATTTTTIKSKAARSTTMNMNKSTTTTTSGTKPAPELSPASGSKDPFDLARFAAAHDHGCNLDRVGQPYRNAIDELKAGLKTGHWIWYVFPQLKGLGSSQTADRFGITGLAEAKAYLADPTLGQLRLVECTQAVLDAREQRNISPARLFGGRGDVDKFSACMTLFAQASDDPNSIFARCLKELEGVRPHQATLDKLAVSASPGT